MGIETQRTKGSGQGHPVKVGLVGILEVNWLTPTKVRELTVFIDWHLEIVARQLYHSTFFGGAPLSESNAARIRKQLQDNIAAFKKLAKFSPYVAGDSFTQADCAAFNNLPLVGMASKAAFGEDLLLAAGIDYKAYLKLVGERPSAQKVVADRKAVQVRK